MAVFLQTNYFTEKCISFFLEYYHMHDTKVIDKQVDTVKFMSNINKRVHSRNVSANKVLLFKKAPKWMILHSSFHFIQTRTVLQSDKDIKSNLTFILPYALCFKPFNGFQIIS